MMVGSAAELLQEIEREQHAIAAKKQRKKKRKGKAAATAESPVALSHEYPCRVHTDDDEQQAAQGQAEGHQGETGTACQDQEAGGREQGRPSQVHRKGGCPARGREEDAWAAGGLQERTAGQQIH